MEKNFRKVLRLRPGEIFIPGTAHKRYQSQHFLSNCTLRFLYRPSTKMGCARFPMQVFNLDLNAEAISNANSQNKS